MRRAALERPDDLSTHLVYADALMEAGDPLGEAMQRQCADPEADVPYAISRRLLGSLFPYVESWRVVRGFLRQVRLHRVSPRDYRRATGRPEWEGVTSVGFARGATVRTLRLPAVEVFGLLTHPACSAVREVLDLDNESFRRLGDASRSFDRVGLDIFVRRDQPLSPLTLSIRVLELTCTRQLLDPVEWLLGTGRPLLDRVEQIVLESPGYTALGLLHEEGTRFTRLETPHLSVTREGARWRARVTPPRFTQRTVHVELPVLEMAIRIATPMLSALELHVPDYGPELLDRLRMAAHDVPFTLVLTGPTEHLELPQCS